MCFSDCTVLLHVYHFEFENEALWLFVVQDVKKRAPWHHIADTLEERRHYQTVFLGGMSTRLNGSINQTQAADTHTPTTRGTVPPTALSPHLFLPNISIMKCAVTYVSSDSAGPENEVLISSMDL